MAEVDAKKPKLDGDAHFSALANLDDFEFTEVLGSMSNVKSIFLLCTNKKEGKPGILLLNKLAFSERPEDLRELLAGARLHHLSDNDIYGNFELFPAERFAALKTTFIYPATQKHIDKYRLRPVHHIQENAQDYQKITLPFIQSSQFSLEWVYNILDGKKEQDLVLFKNPDPEKGFMLLRDLKWDGKTMEEMYYQAIVLRRDLKSVRDLTADSLPLLEGLWESAADAIKLAHGLPRSKLVAYFHYQPSYYHLHAHFRSTHAETSMNFVPLLEVISNLKQWPDFYQKATLGFSAKEGEPLQRLFAEAGRL